MPPGGRAEMSIMQKVTFSISTRPPCGAFELLHHFSYLWNKIAQKSIIQIFDMLSTVNQQNLACRKI